MAISGDTVVIDARQDDRYGRELRFGARLRTDRRGLESPEKAGGFDPGQQDEFGVSVSIDGDTLVVGSWLDNNTGPVDSGSAYIFTRSGGVWAEQIKLTAPTPATGDHFGFSVSASGDTVLIGAHRDDQQGANAGAAYVYTRSGTVWDPNPQDTLFAWDAADGNEFGFSVSLSGDTAVVGSYFDDDAESNSGSAYVFTRSGTSWSQEQKLTASDAAPGDSFGRQVSLSGDTVVAGRTGTMTTVPDPAPPTSSRAAAACGVSNKSCSRPTPRRETYSAGPWPCRVRPSPSEPCSKIEPTADNTSNILERPMYL